MIKDLRLRILRFFRNNKKIVFIVISVIVVVFLINLYLKNRKIEVTPQTTYEPHTSVIDSSSKVPERVSNKIEDMIKEYMDYCNDSNWAGAYNMLSEDCKTYSFDNKISNYMEYVSTKMPTKKKYAIQDYSNDGNMYIYQIKYTDDLLATGLTNSVYQFTEEKMIFKKNSDGLLDMSVGNFVDFHNLKNIFENEYIKVDVQSVVQYYSMEEYTLKLTNRTDYNIVLANNVENNEIVLKLKSGDTRDRLDVRDEIVLLPNASKTFRFSFTKFYDNDDAASSLVFNSVRVMEDYSSISNDLMNTDEVQLEKDKEEQNSIAKFSINLPIKYKD